MSRRSKPKKILTLFNELVEVFDREIPTEFKEIDYNDYIAYSFKTKNGNEYDLEFHKSVERCDTVLDNGLLLSDLVKNKCKEGLINCFDIAFTLSSVEDKENPDEFDKETNKFEHIELMGRIAYIIKKLMSRYSKIKLFIIGESKRNKMDIYKKIFNNHFENKFDIFKGKSMYHDGLSFFIIRK